jgi:hypothetical protein
LPRSVSLKEDDTVSNYFKLASFFIKNKGGGNAIPARKARQKLIGIIKLLSFQGKEKLVRVLVLKKLQVAKRSLSSSYINI